MAGAITDESAALTFQLTEMCAMAIRAMSHATHALLAADAEAATAVIGEYEHSVAMASSADETAFLLLASRPPVAAKLRETVNAIRIAADAKRMVQLAVQVADVARRRHPRHAVPAEVSGRVAELSGLAVARARAAHEVLLSREPRLAAQLCRNGSAAADLHRQLLAMLIDPGWPHGVAAGVDVAQISRLYERFADHALHIAETFAFQTNESSNHRNHKVREIKWSRIAGHVV